MAADVATTLNAWSTTAASNSPSGATAISTNLDDNLREMQAVVRQLAASNTLAAATTTDLSTVDETFVTLTGSAVTITGLGTLTAGMYKWVVFNAAHTLTHNGTSLILPGTANITTAAGDVGMFLSLGSGNWRCLAYQRANGNSTVTLSGLLAANAANTIANADYAQAWQWRLTTASKKGLALTESSASTGTDARLFDVATVASSTAWPINIAARASNIFTVVEDGTVFLSAAPGEDLRIGNYTATGNILTYSNAGNAPSVNITGQGSTGGTGGDVSISGGSSGGGAGGNLTLSAGGGTTGGGDVAISGEDITITNTSGGHVQFYNSRLETFATTAPTISAGGGSGAAITGSDVMFQVTFGTGSPTSVTVDFENAFPQAPMVVATGTQSGQIIHIGSVSTTQVQISSSTAFSSGTKVNVFVIGEGV